MLLVNSKYFSIFTVIFLFNPLVILLLFPFFSFQFIVYSSVIAEWIFGFIYFTQNSGVKNPSKNPRLLLSSENQIFIQLWKFLTDQLFKCLYLTSDIYQWFKSDPAQNWCPVNIYRMNKLAHNYLFSSYSGLSFPLMSQVQYSFRYFIFNLLPVWNILP